MKQYAKISMNLVYNYQEAGKELIFPIHCFYSNFIDSQGNL